MKTRAVKFNLTFEMQAKDTVSVTRWQQALYTAVRNLVKNHSAVTEIESFRQDGFDPDRPIAEIDSYSDGMCGSVTWKNYTTDKKVTVRWSVDSKYGPTSDTDARKIAKYMLAGV